MMTKVLNFLLPCRHKHRSGPRHNLKRGDRRVYQCCIECGKELSYINPELIHNL